MFLYILAKEKNGIMATIEIVYSVM
jgi:hypothetical protein